MNTYTNLAGPNKALTRTIAHRFTGNHVNSLFTLPAANCDGIAEGIASGSIDPTYTKIFGVERDPYSYELMRTKLAAWGCIGSAIEKEGLESYVTCEQFDGFWADLCGLFSVDLFLAYLQKFNFTQRGEFCLQSGSLFYHTYLMPYRQCGFKTRTPGSLVARLMFEYEIHEVPDAIDQDEYMQELINTPFTESENVTTGSERNLHFAVLHTLLLRAAFPAYVIEFDQNFAYRDTRSTMLFLGGTIFPAAPEEFERNCANTLKVLEAIRQPEDQWNPETLLKQLRNNYAHCTKSIVGSRSPAST